MTREEAIKIIKIVLVVAENFEIEVQGEEFTEEKCKEAVDMAIEALDKINKIDKIAHIRSIEDLNGLNCEEAILGLFKTVLEDSPTGWIPVSERLPEDGQNVLFSTKTDKVFEGKFYADTSAHNWLLYKDDTYVWNDVVTAWMPLPLPYKASPTGAEKESDKE